MLPGRPPSSIDVISCFSDRNTPCRLMRSSRSKSSTGYSWAGTPSVSTMPALLTAWSRRPNRSTARSTIARMSASSVTSTRVKTAAPPPDSIAATAFAPPSGSTSPSTTVAPSAASARAEANPIPAAPPVTTATRPSNPPIVRGASRPPRAASTIGAGGARHLARGTSRRDRSRGSSVLPAHAPLVGDELRHEQRVEVLAPERHLPVPEPHHGDVVVPVRDAGLAAARVARVLDDQGVGVEQRIDLGHGEPEVLHAPHPAGEHRHNLVAAGLHGEAGDRRVRPFADDVHRHELARLGEPAGPVAPQQLPEDLLVAGTAFVAGGGRGGGRVGGHRSSFIP